MSKQKYFKNYGQQNQTEAYQALANNEFVEELPFESADSTSLLDAKSPRRDFLKYVGFSTAAATLAASCDTAVKKAIPYAIKPENMTPGIADYFATTYINNGEAIPVLAKVRDGRPIKIEGNDKYSFANGGTTAQIQASVLNLYDTNRLRLPMEYHNGKHEQAPSYDVIDKAITQELAALNGLPVVLLTGTVNSETNKKIIKEFLDKYPGSKHIQHDTISYSGILQANEASFGKRAIPTYNFDKAKVIVSLDADFLGTWLTPAETIGQYAQGRKISDTNKEMSKHYQFESCLSMTGASADERFRHKPSQTAAVAAALLGAVNGTPATLADAALNKGINTVAASLNANAGKALVVAGSNDVTVQLIVNAINNAVNAYGTTISWNRTNNSFAGDDIAMQQLIEDMNASKIGALLIHGVNPVYSSYNSKAFELGLKKVKLTVSFAEKKDETAVLCKYLLPDHNYLESWGDAEPKTGITSFIQPTIAPLFKTRAYQTSLLKWSGNNQDFATYFKTYWINKIGSNPNLDTTLQIGVIEVAAAGSATYNSAKLADAVASASKPIISNGIEVVLYQKVGMGDGRYANNPWLQEMPDPITKATWDNYFIVGAATAKKLNIDFTDKDYEYRPEKPLFTLANIPNKPALTLPIIVVPGAAEDVVAVAVGYGRSENIGLAAKDSGKNVFGYTTYNGASVQYMLTGATLTKASGSYKIAQNQVHNYYEDRFEVIKERTLADTVAFPKHIVEEREKELEPYGGIKDYRAKGTLYPDYAASRAIHWGMSVDLNSCFGCGACVVACNAENNVSVVGKTEVTRGHDMHWLRIDRYYSSNIDKDADNVDVVFAPTMCQHCDNAPCENVCPVAATNHSSEGVNQMTYNRCIGTRYCANNCPYKVRRFNWADYTGADSFPNNQDAASGLSPVIVEQMNDDLTRMVLNPDVTVRSRGVIEKCSFCMQKLQAGKLDAKKESRAIEDKDVRVACAQACASGAIVFGNIKNPKSAIAKIRDVEQTERVYYTLEPLHTLSNVNYLVKVRNKGADGIIAGLEKEEHIAHANTSEHKASTTEEKSAEGQKQEMLKQRTKQHIN